MRGALLLLLLYAPPPHVELAGLIRCAAKKEEEIAVPRRIELGGSGSRHRGYRGHLRIRAQLNGMVFTAFLVLYFEAVWLICRCDPSRGARGGLHFGGDGDWGMLGGGGLSLCVCGDGGGKFGCCVCCG